MWRLAVFWPISAVRVTVFPRINYDVTTLAFYIMYIAEHDRIKASRSTVHTGVTCEVEHIR